MKPFNKVGRPCTPGSLMICLNCLLKRSSPIRMPPLVSLKKNSLNLNQQPMMWPGRPTPKLLYFFSFHFKILCDLCISFYFFLNPDKIGICFYMFMMGFHFMAIIFEFATFIHLII